LFCCLRHASDISQIIRSPQMPVKPSGQPTLRLR
jgi:hypothetical protein